MNIFVLVPCCFLKGIDFTTGHFFPGVSMEAARGSLGVCVCVSRANPKWRNGVTLGFPSEPQKANG